MWCCVSLIVGVAVASWLPLKILGQDILWFGLIIICGVALFLFWDNHNKDKQYLKTVLFLALFLFVGIWRYSLTIPQDLPHKIWHYNGQKVVVTGQVITEPKINGNKTQITIRAERINETKVGGRLLVFAETYPKYEYGDELTVQCKLQTPTPIEDFDYDRYLARSQIYSVCFYPQIALIEKNIKIYTYLLRGKQVAINLIDNGLTEPEASLANAILLGDKSIVQALRLDFSRVGLSHIVAISGMHIGILSVLLVSLLLLLGMHRRQIIYWATTILVVYILLIGAPPSAMRAGILGFLALLAMHIGRLKQATNALVLAAAVMLLFNPRVLRDDVGFQLSFLAVAGIIWLYPWAKKMIEEKVKQQWQPQSRVGKAILDILLITLVAQVFTLPIIAWQFKIISWVAPLANLLVVWLLPVLLVSLLVAIGLSLILPAIAVIWFFPGLIVLKYIIAVATFLSGLPFAAWGW